MAAMQGSWLGRAGSTWWQQGMRSWRVQLTESTVRASVVIPAAAAASGAGAGNQHVEEISGRERLNSRAGQTRSPCQQPRQSTLQPEAAASRPLCCSVDAAAALSTLHFCCWHSPCLCLCLSVYTAGRGADCWFRSPRPRCGRYPWCALQGGQGVWRGPAGTLPRQEGEATVRWGGSAPWPSGQDSRAVCVHVLSLQSRHHCSAERRLCTTAADLCPIFALACCRN